MRLSLSDGYTLPFSTKAEVADSVTGRVLFTGLPVVSGHYRPALPEAIADWRFKMARAATGKDEVAASVEHLLAHITEWDVILDNDPTKKAPLDAAFLRIVPEPIFNQLLNAVNTWASRHQAADEKNSASG
jgi:hypothetical protein